MNYVQYEFTYKIKIYGTGPLQIEQAASLTERDNRLAHYLGYFWV